MFLKCSKNSSGKRYYGLYETYTDDCGVKKQRCVLYIGGDGDMNAFLARLKARVSKLRGESQ